MGLYVGRSRVRRACTAPKHSSLDLYVVNGRLTKRIAAKQASLDDTDCVSAVTTLYSRELRRRGSHTPLCQNADVQRGACGGRVSPPELAINGCNGFLFAEAEEDCEESGGDSSRGGHKRRMGEAARLLLHSDCHKTRIFTNKLRTVPSRSAAAAAARAAARAAGLQEELHDQQQEDTAQCNGHEPAPKPSRSSKRRHSPPADSEPEEPGQPSRRRRTRSHSHPIDHKHTAKHADKYTDKQSHPSDRKHTDKHSHPSDHKHTDKHLVHPSDHKHVDKPAEVQKRLSAEGGQSPPRRRGRPPGRRCLPPSFDVSALSTLFLFEFAPRAEPWFSTYCRLPGDCSVVPALSEWPQLAAAITGTFRLPYQLPEDQLYGQQPPLQLLQHEHTDSCSTDHVPENCSTEPVPESSSSTDPPVESSSSSQVAENGVALADLRARHRRVAQLISSSADPTCRLARKSPRCHASTRAAAWRSSLLASPTTLSLDSSPEQLEQAEQRLAQLLDDASHEAELFSCPLSCAAGGTRRSRRRAQVPDDAGGDACSAERDWFSLLVSECAGESASPSPVPSTDSACTTAANSKARRRRTNRTGWPRKQHRRVSTPSSLLSTSDSESSTRHRRR